MCGKTEINVKEEVKGLWKRCFGDSDAFIDLYFSMRYNEEINRFVVQDGRVVSALQAIPYPMRCFGRETATAYISGACTHPDYRNGGVMRRLLNLTHRRMFDEGVTIATLIPAEEWLRGYYGKSGYATCFYYGQSTALLGQLRYDAAYTATLCAGDEAEVFRYFETRMAARRNVVLHTPDDYAVILADLRLAGGSVWAVRRNGKIAGVAFCVTEGDMPVLKELLYDMPEAKDMLLRKVLSHYGKERIAYLHPEGTLPLGMARIVAVEKVLPLYAESHPEEAFACCVEGDEAIPENNGCYVLEQGRCLKGGTPGPLCEHHTIKSLTERLFRNEPCYMSLMLN